MKRSLFLLIWLLITSGLTSCINISTDSQTPRFHLYILNYNWGTTELSFLKYTRETAWPWIKERNLQTESLWIISDNDIQSYTWSTQKITLSQDATTSLKNAFSESQAPLIGIFQIFAITLDDKWRYGGVISSCGSAAGIQFPTIILEEENELQFSLNIHARNYCPEGLPEYDSDIYSQDIYEYFLEKGKIIE